MIRACAVAFLLLAIEAQNTAHAQPPASARTWSSDSALTIPRGRTEFGLFHPIHWGVTDRVELSSHPVVSALLPHLEAKVRWWTRGRVSIATRHRLSYLSLFLDSIAKEGSLGLLPANTDVPFALAIDTSYLVTYSASESFRFTAEIGVLFAPRASGGDPIVLDFPFLYSRYAVVTSDATVYAGVGATGSFADQFAWQLDARFTPIQVVAGGFVVELGGSLQWFPSRHFGLSLGARIAHGRYPVGVRTHVLPTFDVQFGI
jgi:hypothetical protein